MNYAALKAEIETDPTGKGYAAHLPNGVGEIGKLLNAQTEQTTASRMVTARAILAECQNGAQILDKLEAAAASNSAVKWAVKFLGQDAGVDVGHPATRAMIDQLVTATALSTVDGNQLKAMAAHTASRAEIIGVGYVHDSDVRDALRT
jgi:hypothetical protein